MAGRPKKEINQEEFEKLCELHCTMAEICSFFDVTDKTLSRWCRDVYGKNFSDVYDQKSEAGKISLRRSQFRLAEKNAAMAIFLGKNYLGQTDKQENVISGVPVPDRLILDFGDDRQPDDSPTN